VWPIANTYFWQNEHNIPLLKEEVLRVLLPIDMGTGSTFGWRPTPLRIELKTLIGGECSNQEILDFGSGDYLM